MTDILTKEERKTVEEARAVLNTIDLCETAESVYDRAADLSAHVDNLLAIIDNLSKRGVKKCSEEELRSEFENGDVDVRRDGWSYVDIGMTNSWYGFYRCARFLGALEEKQ